MSYKVRIESFEGPFDLLLYLVTRQKVDIGSISITEIADQYLAEVSRMQTLDLEVASDFLLVASTLLEIKAQSLIPRERDELDEDIVDLAPSEARDILVDRLMEYKKYKNAAQELYARYKAEGRQHGRPFGPDACFLQVMPDFLEGVSLDKLAYLAAHALARREVFLLESEHIAAKPIPVEVHVRAIHRRIQTRKHLRFSELIGPQTSADLLVVTFLAVLELYKRVMVNLTQDEAFGDIAIDYIEGSGELHFEGEDALTSVEEGQGE
jgi:segregation and condensation protein A